MPSRCPEEHFRRRHSLNKILKLLFFGVWTEECLTSVRTFCQRWQPWIPCAQKTKMISRFFSENFVFFSSYLYSKGKLCCFWRKLFGRFELPEENLEKNMIGEVFFISNLLENQQFFFPFWKQNSISFHNFAFYVFDELFEEENLSEKKTTFSSVLNVGGNVSGFLAKCFPQNIRAAF